MKRKKATVPEYIYAKTYEGPAEDRYSTAYYNAGCSTATPTIRRVQVHVRKGQPFIYPYVFDLAVVPHEPDATTFDELVFESNREKERREPRANVKRVSNRWKPYGPRRVYFPAEYLTARQLCNAWQRKRDKREEEQQSFEANRKWFEEFINEFQGISASLAARLDRLAKRRGESLTVLGLDKDADGCVIKRRYHELACRTHPDHGGDLSAFRQVQEAADFRLKGVSRV